ncbi:MAG: hypothetical protein ACK5IJ_00720 [Mangrovibacterium sp.]
MQAWNNPAWQFEIRPKGVIGSFCVLLTVRCVRDWRGNPFEWALPFAHLKDWNGKPDGRARECGGEECRHAQKGKNKAVSAL